MPFELFVARKYLRSKQKSSFIRLSLINYFSTLGVMIGVAALIIALSVANGFEEEVRSRIIGFDAHVKLRTFHDRGIQNWEQVITVVDSMPEVVASGPYIHEKGLIKSANTQDFVALKAIDPEKEAHVTNLVNNINWGALNLGMIDVEGERSYPGIVIGRWLADRLRVNLGERVQVLSAKGIELGGFGANIPFRTFRVAGYFETGLYDYDNLFAFISVPDGQKVFAMDDRVSGIQIKLADIDDADAFAEKLNEKLKYPYFASTWFSLNKTLFSWMEIEKRMIFLVLSLIIAVATFNIVGTLIMVVMEKRRDIGILKSMGSNSNSILKVFMFQGLFSGVIGTLLGLALGFAFCWSQVEFGWISIPGDVYIVDALPMKMLSLDFFLITIASLFLCFIATLYPAWKASKLDPIEAIRDN